MRPLHSAVAAGDHDAARALLEAGADPNVRQQGGFTPLLAAAHADDAEMAAAAARATAPTARSPPTTAATPPRWPASASRRCSPEVEAAHQRFFLRPPGLADLDADRQSAVIRARQAAPTAAQRPAGTP